MEYQVMGVERRAFKPKDSEREIVGYNIYVAYEKNGVEGLASNVIYVKQRIIDEIGKVVPGMKIDYRYNSEGKVDTVEIIKSK